ncbi:hypothetical protein AKN88_08915 [Thiopseudomonas alkaliphila]|uniref:UDP-N-acetylenolpyruvoylglucosamine reductase n=1 Tax=Thiopseudomonas alkaliphila TaxID=1697053 RepID=A0A0K1XFC0_9GAMM|nr:FAD-binding protein [Thiopseudomonas alkaliphila]AKX60036.1 hypothetical protein AKN88_08915 [Thiopseudomonas alkaliphila]
MTLNLEPIRFFLEHTSIPYASNVDIKYKTYFMMGGLCEIFITPSTLIQLECVLLFLETNKLKYKVIGNTSNLIFVDEGHYSILISTINLNGLKVTEQAIEADTGALLPTLSRVALINGFSGFEGIEGIPATVGGALFMNAGAYGCSISDKLTEVKVFDRNEQQVLILNNDECRFSYRKSIFREDNRYIVLSAKFYIEKGCKDTIANKMETYHIARHSYQEFCYPNLGSMISVTGDYYAEIFKKDKVYYLLYLFLKVFFRNPVVKFLRRKKPHSSELNYLLKKYFERRLKILVKNHISNKGANILVNDGNVSAEHILSYVKLMHNEIGESWHIENEVVFDF